MSNIIDELLLLAGVRKKEVEAEPLDMASIVSEARACLTDLIAQRQAEIVAPDPDEGLAAAVAGGIIGVNWPHPHSRRGPTARRCIGRLGWQVV